LSSVDDWCFAIDLKYRLIPFSVVYRRWTYQLALMMTVALNGIVLSNND